jgi:hypothetical protein
MRGANGEQMWALRWRNYCLALAGHEGILHKIAKLVDCPMDALRQLHDAASSGRLVAMFGAGSSIALAAPATPAKNWRDLLGSAFEFALDRGRIDGTQYGRWSDQISSDDLDELLSAADFVTRKLGGSDGILYARWFEKTFQGQKARNGPMREAINSLAKNRVPIATLNYDTLLERATKSHPIHMKEPKRVMDWARRDTNDILHLHGVWTHPDTCVFGMTDYTAATEDAFRANLQKALSSLSTIVFIGCGDTLRDPNFLSIFGWMRDVLSSAASQHYVLLRNDQVAAAKKDAAFQGFVEPLGFGDSHDQLPQFLKQHLIADSRERQTVRKAKRAPEKPVVEAYRQYVVRDCGQMTIEGVRADADTAKQKFDIEQLFVPLSVNAIPPDFSENDKKREEKLQKWLEENSEPLAFGEAFSKRKRMALLALPGGGKTLLLKRLAVAYADANRRSITPDQLPALDLLPILIRCREWRDHIRLPIGSIIERLSEITGQSALEGLFDAIKGRLTGGKILLLIDGLDEIHSDADRTIFVDNIEAFLAEFPKIRLVVTSREAGFALIAPCLMRFCTRWRISPLSSEAIKLLCIHWHNLMGGLSKETEEEIDTVFGTIMKIPALVRLAENPLLLTMLLVVKHGHGRLPPDRVSLYERAVEVLLDTWNIKGHARLNPREAVPQLSYIAFKLMEAGKQTVTEKELLELIEQCRHNVPLVKLYARDTPSEFLQRVELRSSLVLEGGKVFENGKAVSFYQFRHLTFQEYLAAVAVVEGHYDHYKQGDSPLTPLLTTLIAEEWKEVIPMAAVLAKKQARPILAELIDRARVIEHAFLAGGYDSSEYAWSGSYRLPAPIARLTQCLVEEAEFPQDLLQDAVRLVATFAHGCQSGENWDALGKGPFGEELYQEAWRLYKTGTIPRQAWLRNTVALFAAHRRTYDEWLHSDALSELRIALRSGNSERKGWAAAVVCGALWLYGRDSVQDQLIPVMFDFQLDLEDNLKTRSPAVWEQTAWALGLIHARAYEQDRPVAKFADSTVDLLVKDFVSNAGLKGKIISSFALSYGLRFDREEWRPILDHAAKELVIDLVNGSVELSEFEDKTKSEAAALLAYHARSLVPDEVLLSHFRDLSGGNENSAWIKRVEKELA